MRKQELSQGPIALISLDQVFALEGYAPQVNDLKALTQSSGDPHFAYNMCSILYFATKLPKHAYLAGDPKHLLQSVRFALTIRRLFSMEELLLDGPSAPCDYASWAYLADRKRPAEIRFILDYVMAYEEKGYRAMLQRLVSDALPPINPDEDDWDEEKVVHPEQRDEYRQLMQDLETGIVAFMCIFREAILGYAYPNIDDL